MPTHRLWPRPPPCTTPRPALQPLQLRLPNAVPWLLQQRAPLCSISLDPFLLLPPGGGPLAAWEAQAVHELALAAAAFAAPHTQPAEDCELLLRSAATGSLLSSLQFRPSPAAVQAVVASVGALAQRRRQWRTERTAFLGALSTARAARPLSLAGAELAALLRVELPGQQPHLIARQRGRHGDLPAALRCVPHRSPWQRCLQHCAALAG